MPTLSVKTVGHFRGVTEGLDKSLQIIILSGSSSMTLQLWMVLSFSLHYDVETPVKSFITVIVSKLSTFHH